MQSHLDHIRTALAVGAENEVTLLDDQELCINQDIDREAILAIPDNVVFDPEDSYCPTSDIPNEVASGYGASRVQYRNNKVYVLGDNGMCMFMFRGTVQS